MLREQPTYIGVVSTMLSQEAKLRRPVNYPHYSLIRGVAFSKRGDERYTVEYGNGCFREGSE